MKDLMAILYLYDLALVDELSARARKRALDILYSRPPEIDGDY